MDSTLFAVLFIIISLLLIGILAFGFVFLVKKYGRDTAEATVESKISYYVREAEKIYEGLGRGLDKKAYVMKMMAAYLVRKKIYITEAQLSSLVETVLSIWQLVWAALKK